MTRLKTYTVLYAEDIPHYAHGEIEARGPEDAIARARKLDPETFGAYDADWTGAICRRIVYIQDPAGNDVARDLSLDEYHLRNGGEADRRLCDAAAALLETLEFIAGHAWLARTNYGPDDRQSLKNRNASLDEIERRARMALSRAGIGTGRAP